MKWFLKLDIVLVIRSHYILNRQRGVLIDRQIEYTYYVVFSAFTNPILVSRCVLTPLCETQVIGK